MVSIDVDFDVFKELTVRRATEAVSYNDVIRVLLGLRAQARDKAEPTVGCVFQGVRFPEGTLFQATHKGRTYAARIKDGAWWGDDGKRYHSPSHAARAVTGKNWNGWLLWKCKRPGDATWRLINELRDNLASLA